LKRVLADHNVPAPLLRLLKAVDIKSASSKGWQKLMNGKLLAVAEEAGFEVLLSGDKTIKDELLIGGRKIGMVCMRITIGPPLLNMLARSAKPSKK
jgi:hypothetical protein